MIPYLHTTPFWNVGGTAISIVEFVKEDAARYGFFRNPPSLAITAQPAGVHKLIEDLGKLEYDWDGYGALPISPESRVFARNFLATVSPATLNPEISPSSNGTIRLEWQSSDGEAYIEIGRTRYSGYIQSRNGSTIYIEGQSARLGQEELAVIERLLYATSGAKSLTNSTQITQPAF